MKKWTSDIMFMEQYNLVCQEKVHFWAEKFLNFYRHFSFRQKGEF